MRAGEAADALARAVARLRPRRTVSTGPPPVRVNLGSGLAVAPGWIHLDGSIHALLAGAPPRLLRALHRRTTTLGWLTEQEYVRRLRGHRFLHHELERPLPFPAASVDFLYASHVLEHLFPEDADRLLAETHRVLRPGGVVRIAVPDLAHALELYREGRKKASLAFFFEGRAGYYRRHRYMYDEELLRGALRRAGYAEVVRRSYRDGEVPDLELLDNRPEETLFMEARRG